MTDKSDKPDNDECTCGLCSPHLVQAAQAAQAARKGKLVMPPDSFPTLESAFTVSHSLSMDLPRLASFLAINVNDYSESGLTGADCTALIAGLKIKMQELLVAEIERIRKTDESGILGLGQKPDLEPADHIARRLISLLGVVYAGKVAKIVASLTATRILAEATTEHGADQAQKKGH